VSPIQPLLQLTTTRLDVDVDVIQEAMWYMQFYVLLR